ncbi:condensation domain-containing protein, partial [Corynebacterium neomassiliense]|uniref:condensation domain-containing protein n=1 Tax=Corynebacterium neomassiliense TaxID=2079482 RepID=UPI001F32158D
ELAALADSNTDADHTTSALPRVADITRPDTVPASYGQQALWLIDQTNQSKSQYVVPLILKFTGTLVPQTFEQALRDVVIRQEALRTRLIEQDDILIQDIIPANKIPDMLTLPVVELTGRSEQQVIEHIDTIIQAGFALDRDIPIRGELLHTGDDTWILALAIHHHAVDEWSMPSLTDDLATAYTARLHGQTTNWDNLPVQYAEYATWQHQFLGDPNDPDSLLAKHLDYWKNQLSAVPDESTITPDRPRPVQPTYAGQDLTTTLPASTTATLRNVLDDRNITMFMAVQAATAITVSSLGAGDDVVIGSPVGGRTEDGLENLVGYFVNTLPLRHRLSPEFLLTDVLDNTRDLVLDGFAHQVAPFDQIARTVNSPRLAGRNPLFQVMLTHHAINAEYLESAGFAEGKGGLLASRYSNVGINSVKNDLDVYTIGAAGRSNQLSITVSYSTELFDHRTINRFLSVFVGVLDTMATAPDTRVGDLDVLTDADRDNITTWSVGEEL